jgi:hypothetical protein
MDKREEEFFGENIIPDNIFNSDVDFLNFIFEEDEKREKAKSFTLSSSLFKTYVESRVDYNEMIKKIGGDMSGIETVYGYDVYVVVDSTYMSLGIYPTIKEARRAETAVRLRLERDIKDYIRTKLSA